jgi:elongation factor Ts
MTISLEQIKILREKSGAGMVDCKKAMEEAGGDIEKAMEALRKKGIAKAAKRVDREAGEGIIKVAISQDHKEGYIVEVNAETDFVVRSAQFQDFATKVLNIVSLKKPANLEELLSLDFDGSTVADALGNLSGIIGEKLAIKRCAVLGTNGTVASYSHMGGRIGVLVAVDQGGKEELAYEVAMQIAAANPICIGPQEVPDELLAKEKEIFREQLLREGKPENMIDKIMEGKVEKYYGEVCLIKQEYIKDDKKKVADILGGVKVEKFIKFSL